jgi:hypothetical protein
MALRIEDLEMSNITAATNFDQVDAKELSKFLSLFGQDVINTVNGNLDFAANFGAKLLTVTIATANTDTAVNHGLGRLAIGRIVYAQTCNGAVYDGSTGTAQTLYIKCSALGTVSLIVF